jgi:hypothetical protein
MYMYDDISAKNTPDDTICGHMDAILVLSNWGEVQDCHNIKYLFL